MEHGENNRANDSDQELELEQTILAIVKNTLPAVRFAKNTAKALRRLSSVGTDTLVSALEAGSSWFQLKKARNENLLAELAKLPRGQSAIGVKVADNLVQEQRRIDQLVFEAIEHIQADESSESPGESEKVGKSESSDEIGDDWLECFRREAAVRTQGEMRETFARILAGEIRHPGKFSIRTLRTVGSLDQSTATLFRKAASLRVSMELVAQDTQTGSRIYILDARIPSLGGQLGDNFLENEGLAYSQLIHLTENGLLHSDYDSWSIYNYSIFQQELVRNVPIIPLFHQNQNWVLKPLPKFNASSKLKIHGAKFTTVGQELLHIVDIEKNAKFLEKLKTHLKQKNVELIPFAVT